MILIVDRRNRNLPHFTLSPKDFFFSQLINNIYQFFFLDLKSCQLTLIPQKIKNIQWQSIFLVN